MNTQVLVDSSEPIDALNHTTDTYVAHLLAQIDFLHNEIDRLESLHAAARMKSNTEHSRTVEHYESLVMQKNSEVSALRSKLSTKSDPDALARCSALEKQLAAANSEKNVAIIEKNELKAKVRKLESDLRSKNSLLKTQAMARTESTEESEALQKENSQLLEQLQQLADENKLLRTELQDEKERSTQTKKTVHVGVQTVDIKLTTTVPVSTQTEEIVSSSADKGCQVDSAIHFSQSKDQTVFSLAQLLEEKTQECDSLRSTLDDLKAVQEDTLQMLETTKKRLSEEVQNYQLSSDDTEKLTLQIRSLQQKLSKQTATERELLGRIASLEESRQQLQKEAIHIESEKRTWQSQIHQTENDIEQLVANKNYCNQQLSLMSNENENLRTEVQRLLQRESQLAFTLKAKDAELHEIIKAYQNATKENDIIAENQRFLERELDSIRATLASKEEGIIYLQEQLSSLHQREQQLVLDLQTFEYENDQLNRRILQNDCAAAQVDARCNELQQILFAKDQALEELHQNLSELSKQVVIKENESQLLRRRGEALENDVSQLRSLVTREREKTRNLEDCNARLTTLDVLSTQENEMQTLLKRECSVLRDKNAQLEKRLFTESELKNDAYVALQEEKKKLKEVMDAKDRLERIVLDQNATLSNLAK